MQKRLRIVLLFLIGAVLSCLSFLFIYWFRGYRHYDAVFLPHTNINGQDCSDMTAKQAAKQAVITTDTELVLHTLDVDVIILLSDIDYQTTCEVSDVFDVLQSQNNVIWMSSGQYDYEVPVQWSWDMKKLHQVLQNLDIISGDIIQAPKDAYIQKGVNSFEIVSEVNGNQLDVQKVSEVVEKALLNHVFDVDLVAMDCYVKPSVYAMNVKLNEDLAKLNALCQRTITIDLTDANEVLDSMVLTDWLDFDGTTAVFNESKINSYVSDLASKYATSGTKREFHTSDGQLISIGGNDGDTYGFSMDQKKTMDRLWSALGSFGDQKVTPVWTTMSQIRNSKNGDIGTTYVEISIEKQHMWYYVDGKLVVNTDVTTGLMTPDRMTPTGLFQVLNKLEDYTMRGSYGSAWANYVVPINDNGICIHDAPWRSQYGGTIYVNDGSHGCINTPYEPMKQIFDNITYGTPVIIY